MNTVCGIQYNWNLFMSLEVRSPDNRDRIHMGLFILTNSHWEWVFMLRPFQTEDFYMWYIINNWNQVVYNWTPIQLKFGIGFNWSLFKQRMYSMQNTAQVRTCWDRIRICLICGRLNQTEYILMGDVVGNYESEWWRNNRLWPIC